MKKEIRAWLILLALQIPWISACGYSESHKETEEPQMISEWEDITRFDMYDVDAHVSIEEVVIETVKQAPTEIYRVTAYCACKKCTNDGDGITATGTQVKQGRTVAVDPEVIPYGTALVIEGFSNEFIAEDCGGKWIHGNEIDIFFESHEQAEEFGVQYLEVKVVE